MLIALLLATESVSPISIPDPAPGARVWTRNNLRLPTACPARPAGERAVPGAAGLDVYPPTALRRHEQGRVVTGVDIAPGGCASRCWIIVSSGSDALDEATCRMALARVRWTPALDEAGVPTMSRAAFPTIWRLPTKQ